MGYKTNNIKNIRTINAWRGESLTIDLGAVQEGTLTAWMKKDPDSPTYRSFTILENRYLFLPADKASDYYVDGVLYEAVEGKWYFDVESTTDVGDPDVKQTIFRGTILFQNDITNSNGVEVNPPTTDQTFLNLDDTPSDYAGQAGNIPRVNITEDALEFFDIDTELANKMDIDGGNSNVDVMSFDTTIDPVTLSGGQVKYNNQEYTLDIGTGLADVTIQVGQEQLFLFYNDTGEVIENGKVLYPVGRTVVDGVIAPTVELAKADRWETCQGTLTVSTMQVPDGQLGLATRFGRVRGVDTSLLGAGAQIWLSDTVAGDFVNTQPEFPSYVISMGGTLNADPTDGQLFVSITTTVEDTVDNAWDGAIRETFDFRVTSDGVTITGTLTNSGNPANDLTAIFSDGFYTVDTTTVPKTLSLVAGTATNIQLNYIYIDKATKTLQTSTSGFPEEEHAKIAIIGLFDAVTTQADGAIRNQNINDHIKKETDNGHILHIAERLRALNSEWDSGTAGTLTGAPTNLYVAITSGKVWQLHKQDIPAQDMALGDEIHVVNDPTTPYRNTTNLNDISTYSDGSTWNNDWTNFVVWGVANKTGEAAHLMVNLSSGGYNTEENAIEDRNNFSNYTIPNEFKGVGFLIARFTVRRSGANFTYNSGTGYLDLRGFVPNNTAGGGTGSSGITEFLQLNDTPSSYVGQAGKKTVVNATETAIEFVNDTEVYRPSSEPIIISGTPNTLTLDSNNKFQSLFEPSKDASNRDLDVDFDMVFANDSNIIFKHVILSVTGTITITMPTDTVQVEELPDFAGWDINSGELTLALGVSDKIKMFFVKDETEGVYILSLSKIISKQYNLRILDQVSGITSNPSGIAIDENRSLIYLLERVNGDLLKLDAETLIQIDSINLSAPNNANTILYDPVRDVVYVFISGEIDGEVVEIDPDSFTINTIRNYGDTTNAVAGVYDGNGNFHISDLADVGGLTFNINRYADPTDITRDSVLNQNDTILQMQLVGNKIYATGGYLSTIKEFNYDSNTVTDKLVASDGLRQPRGIYIDKDKDLLISMYCNDVATPNKLMVFKFSTLELLEEHEVNGNGQLRQMAKHIYSGTYFCCNLGSGELIKFKTFEVDRTPRLFIIAGQSNAVGSVGTAPPPNYLASKMENIKDLGHNVYIWSIVNQQWEILEYRNNQLGADEDSFGIELELGYKAALKYQTDIYIFKYAESGTGLGLDAGERDWNIVSTGELYDEIVSEGNAAISAISAEYKAESFYWNQGERDSLVLAKANAYETNFRNFVNAIRANLINCRFVVTRLHAPTYTYYATVRTAHENSSSMTKSDKLNNTYLINLDDLVKLGDNIHYDGASQITIANRVLEYQDNYI